PFLGFLNAAPEQALECTLAIVDHATARWQSGRNTVGESDAAFEVVLDGRPVKLCGDAEVMHWHRGESRVPSVLASALMAVEAWLYRRLDDDAEIHDSLSS